MINPNFDHDFFASSIIINIKFGLILFITAFFYLYFTEADQRKMRILVSIVVVFIVSGSFSIVADIYEMINCAHQNVENAMCLSNEHIENMIDISHFILSLTASVNFLFYVLHDKHFRDAFLKVPQFALINFIILMK
jgi:4-amino-4-deoxy-L-arabinose transferase-like glycosyltransferase